MKKNILTLLAISGLSLGTASASIVFDDFNLNEGRFNTAPTFDGSTVGYQNSSTADQVTGAGALEGAGYERLSLDRNAATTDLLFRSSGTGSPANTSFTLSAGTDGWIGYYLKTSSAGTWNTQPWITGATPAGAGVMKTVITDGQWHLYEWNLDDVSGGADGWGEGGASGRSFFPGVAALPNGSYTIQSIYLNGGNANTSGNVLDLDFVAKSDAGSIAALAVPEPSTIALGLLGGAGLMAGYFRRRAKK